MFIWPVVALLAILALVRWLGSREEPRLTSAEDARRLLSTEHPDVSFDQPLMGTDHRSSIAGVLGKKSVAVAFVIGNEVTSRIFNPGDLRDVVAAEGVDEVEATLVTADIGCPELRVRIPAAQWPGWSQRLRQLVATTAVFLLAPSMSGAQGGACGGARFAAEPAEPRQGAFFTVRGAALPDGVQLGGEVAGEPLHFTPTGQGAAASLAGVAVDAPERIPVRVWCVRGEVADTQALSVLVRRGNYAVERLRVSPQFAAKPDSALEARIARESARARAVAVESHATPRLWTDPFMVPRRARITSEYGRGREFNGAITSRHLGTDFAGGIGAPVRAINRGVVRIVDAFFYGGNVVYLDHGDGVSSAYLHLSRTLVAEGDTVARGAPVGEVGATGRVTGPHLHLITRLGGTSLDAMSLLRLLGDSAEVSAVEAMRPPPRAPARPRRRKP